eukprot:scaffold37327_cov20-Tisochrysis_lutea.AAC.2
MLITGSWDKTLRFWDCRSPTPVHTQPLPERVYAMDVNYPMVGVMFAASVCCGMRGCMQVLAS